ncbi:hypothetical protein CEXT_111481 [Caerostris extrusa]|uniref:Uncharacterized protein n=1 Tax=Caerostris extrusa TaxID=172846 RepID=A0AAV4W333_CAEEX|nr:hypothetical protein CEXT_111481 [Caerostris extrusa]
MASNTWGYCNSVTYQQDLTAGLGDLSSLRDEERSRSEEHRARGASRRRLRLQLVWGLLELLSIRHAEGGANDAAQLFRLQLQKKETLTKLSPQIYSNISGEK